MDVITTVGTRRQWQFYRRWWGTGFGVGELGVCGTYQGTSRISCETGVKHRRDLAGILWLGFQQHKHELEGQWLPGIRQSSGLSGTDCVHLHCLPLDGDMGPG